MINGTHQTPPEGFYDDLPEAGATPVGNPWEKHLAPVPPAWFEKAPAGRTWLLRDSRRLNSDGVLPLGKVGQIIAEGGAGKTMLLCQLALAVGTGGRWLGTFDVATPGRVLLVLGEEELDEVHRRLFRARNAVNGAVPPEGRIVSLPLAGVPSAMLEKDERGNLAEAWFLRWLREWLKRNGPWSLVVVDPLSRFAGPDAEIDNAAATRFVQALESLATDTGATILVAHHTTKAARAGGPVLGAAGRGSSALLDGVRWQASLGIEKVAVEGEEARERLGEIAVLTFTKSNYSRRADPVLLRRDTANGGALLALDDTDEETVDRYRSGDAARDAREAKRESDRHRKVLQDAAALAIHVRDNPGTSVRQARAFLFADSSKRWAAATHALGRSLMSSAAGLVVEPAVLPSGIRALVSAVDSKVHGDPSRRS